MCVCWKKFPILYIVYDDISDILLPFMPDHFWETVLLTDYKWVSQWCCCSCIRCMNNCYPRYHFQVSGNIYLVEIQQRNNVFDLYFYLVTCVWVFLHFFRWKVSCGIHTHTHTRDDSLMICNYVRNHNLWVFHVGGKEKQVLNLPRLSGLPDTKYNQAVYCMEGFMFSW